eukprot:6669030-Ditylum_brightwellii.AAC.1
MGKCKNKRQIHSSTHYQGLPIQATVTRHRRFKAITIQSFVLSELPTSHLHGKSGSNNKKAYIEIICQLKHRSPDYYLTILHNNKGIPSTKMLALQGTMSGNSDNKSFDVSFQDEDHDGEDEV